MGPIKRIFSAIILISLGVSAWAIPAKIGVQTYTQPDGTTIKIRKVGNGNLHFTVTEDGTLLKQDENGFYNFAKINENGRIESLGIKALSGVPEPEHVTRIGDPAYTNLISTRAGESENEEAPVQWGMGKYKNKYPTTGSPRVPVFLVDFPEVKFATWYDPVEYYNKLFNGDGTPEGDKGSIRKYFEDQSGGKFSPQFDVYGPITMPKSITYYGGNYSQDWDVNARYMVTDAATILDDEIDFTSYDQDEDGSVDFIYIIYAGFGEHRQGGEDTIWPHAGDLQRLAAYKKVDGLWLKNFACSNELIDETNPEGTGIIVHEYSHIIGLPDVYTVDTFLDPIDFTPGFYSIMDYGVYNNDGLTPPNYSAYERNALKWNEPIVFDRPMSISLEDISSGQFGLIKTDIPEEFFLVENRQQTGHDEYIPGHGLLIWHIDYQESKFTNNIVNKDPSHLYVDVVRANNANSFITMSEGYTFPGTTGKTSFTSETDPAMVTWKGKPVDCPITNIEERDGVVYFDIMNGKQEDAGISGITSDDDGLYRVYTLTGAYVGQGDRSFVSRLSKGIYIINGKKVTVNPSKLSPSSARLSTAIL